MEKKAQDMVFTLAECVAACRHCFKSCLGEKDVQMMAECIKLDIECADICALAMTSVASGDRVLREILGLCAEACRACAEECGKHHYDHCQECARVCKECAKSCESYA